MFGCKQKKRQDLALDQDSRKKYDIGENLNGMYLSLLH